MRRFLPLLLPVAVFAQLPPSTSLPPGDRAPFDAEIARIERLLASAPDKAAVTYQMARTWASAQQWPEAIGWLRKLDPKFGLDPAHDSIFSPVRDSSEFRAILTSVRDATPPISHSQPAFNVPEGDLVPESMAYDSQAGYFYFGSMRKGKVIRCSANGKCLPFATGLGTVLGLKVHDNGLYVLNNSDRGSALIHYDLATARELVRSSVSGPGHTFNDLTIASKGDVYLTDTPAGAVWHFAKGSSNLSKLPGRFEFANGIALSPDNKLLYISTYPDGITIADLKTGTTSPIPRPANLCLAWIDGLYFHHGALVAIQNGFMNSRVIRLRLSPDLRSLDDFEILERRNPLFDGITTGVVRGNDFFYMANIQDEKKSGFNPITILKLHL